MKDIVSQCKRIYQAYHDGQLGDTTMPEDTHPKFPSIESQLAYFTLPMALNYQRNSFSLWKAANSTFAQSPDVFDVKKCSQMSEQVLREKLLRHKLALQPNKHINTWIRIAITIYSEWETFEKFFNNCEYDFLKLQQTIQYDFKKGFPYLSGPKIFNYWSFIIQEYGGITLAHSDHISIAPDTHIIQASLRLGVINEDENLSRDAIAQRWKELLAGSGIKPIEMHSPLWFWSRSGFILL